MEKIEENGITYVMGASTGDSGFDWQKSSNYFCANGREITISAREGGCTVSWVSDDGVERSKDLPADVTICGGSWDGEVSSSKITMTGGTVNGGLFGGGVTADSKVTGNVEINVLGGTLYDGVVGGGVCGSVGGNVAIGIGNAEGGPYIQDNVIGGGFMDSADVAGNVTVSINNGQIGTGSSSNTAIVTGGGVFGDVSGKVTVNVADGDVYAIVSGGSMISGDVNQSEINVSGGTVRCVSGGSIDYLMTGDAGSVKNVVINITDGEITNSVYGGSIRRGDIEESAVVNISGGTIGTDGEAEVIVAGSQIGDITGSATVNISNEGEAAPKINGAIKGADSILLNNKPVSLAVIYVDASATTSDIANGKIVGVNVFDSFITALKNVNADTTEIKISGDLTESATDENVAVVLSKDLTISGNVKWDSGKGWIQFKKDNGVDSVNLNFADFELSGAASNTKVFYFSDGVTATVDKDSSLEFYNGAIQPGATVKVENGGKFICLKEALQVQANGDKRATFIVEGEDTVAYTKYVNVSADANVTDSKFSANDYINVRDAGVFTADNSVVEIGTNESGVWYSNPVPNGLGRLQVSGTDSVFNLTNGSTLKASGNITNNGTINIEDSTFLANGTLVSDGVVLEAYNKGVVTNNGTINVSGESTLTIRELAGEAIKVLDGASLTDSVIGGAVDLVSGESNWSGKNTVTGIFSAGYNNYEKGDIETAITGEFTNTNFLTWNTEGAKTVVNIGEADGDRTAFNGGQIGIFERSEINIANADVTYNYAFIRSDFNVSDSTLTITNVNTYFSGAAHVTVENSTWTIGAYSCLGSYGYETADGSAVVTLLGNSTMNAGNLKLSATEGTDHNVSLNVEDATVNISSSLTVGAGAEVTLTEKSLINATGAAVTNNGSFAVNVTDGWSGIKTVIDGKAGTDSFGNVVIDSADAANGVKSYVDAEKGDLMIYNIKCETVYVDSAWTGYRFGDEIAEGKYYGINAYDSLLGYKAAAETKTLEIAGGTYESVFNTTTDVSVMNGGINTVNASGEVVVSVGSLVFETEVKGDVYINGAFTTTDPNTWNYEQNMMPYYNGTIQFKGGKDTTFNIDGTFNAAEGFTFDAGKTIISEDSVLTINDQHCGQFNIYGEVTNYGQMTVDLQVGSTLRLVNIGDGGSLILSGEKASLTTNIVNDQPWAGAQCVDFYIQNGSLTVEDGAKVSATGIVEVYSDGSINVSDAEFSAAAVTNNGTVTVSGASTLNGAFTGNALSVESGTVLSGSLAADLVLKGNVTVTADFDGTILGNKKVYITEDNKFNLSADGNKIAGIIVSDGIVFGEGENLGSVAIEGADKNAVITIADSALNGNKFSKGKLVIINDEDDNFIAVNTDLSLIKAIREGDDEFAVESVSGLYYYINGEGVTQILSKTGRGIKISNSSDDNGGNTEVAVDNVKKFDIKEDSTALANVNVEMAEGISTIKVSNGSTTKDGAVDLMKFSIGAVSKDKNGGKNNFTFGNYNDVKINGDIEALGSLTLGNDSFLKVKGDVSGNNKSQNIKIGSNSNAKFGDIKFDVHGCPGDKDRFSIAGSSVVTTGTLTGLEVLKLDNGTEDKQTEMIVDGDIVAPMVNSTITLGKYAKLEIKGKVDNGDVACVTGTTFKIADNSGGSITDAVTGMAGLTLGNNSKFTAADISGTEKTNKVVLGKDAEMYAGAIDLKTGKNSIKLSDGAYLRADSVSNVQKLTVGKDSRLLASEINGTDDNDTWKIGDASEIGLNGRSVDLNFGAGKDSVKIGKNVEAYFADVDFGAGNDSLMIGAESVVFFDTLDMGEGSKDVVKLDKNSKTYVRELENVNELSASAGAELWFSEGGCGADVLSKIGGSWNNATICDEIGSLDFKAAMSGQVFANEWDVYHFDSVNDGTLTLEAAENVKLQYSFNGSDWFVYDGSLAYDGGSNLSVRVAVDDEFNKEDIADKKGYSFTATIA